MEKAVKFAKECLKKAQDRQKSQADKHRRKVTYKVDDKVMLNTKNLRLADLPVRKLVNTTILFFIFKNFNILQK